MEFFYKYNEEHKKNYILIISSAFIAKIKGDKSVHMKMRISKTSLESCQNAALAADKFKQINDALNAMQSNYAKVHYCSFKNRTKCDLQLEPGIELNII